MSFEWFLRIFIFEVRVFLYHQDCEIIEDGKKHTLVLHNCKLDMTGEVSFQAANAKSAANLKVKGTVCQHFHVYLRALEQI